MSEKIILEVKNIDKYFPGTQALSKVSFQLYKGEILALAGENGAGKSTLMNIIDGIHQPDSGEILIDGNQVKISNPLEAQQQGIGFVHQEIALCPQVTVAENIYMAAINTSKKWFVDYKKLYQNTIEILQTLSPIPPEIKVRDLSISNQQIVEIAKALTLDCKILILDEPTASLTEQETEALFKIMQNLKKKGISIIYISHRMVEIFEQCDRIFILRDGQGVVSFYTKDTTPEEVVNQLVGRTLDNLYPSKMEQDLESTEVLLEVQNLSDGARFKDINFKLYQGEILGLSGLIGAGRSEMVKAICGLNFKQSGNIFFRGKKLTIRDYKESIQQGIVYLSEDRKKEGVFLELAIDKNISALNLNQVSSKFLFIDSNKEKKQALDLANKLELKFANISNKVSSLSGGNQQKIVIAKLLSVNPAIVIMDEPTRGIDVGAKSGIHNLLRDLANQGIGVIVISSELPEVIGLCDRVVVMQEGQQYGIVSGNDLQEETIMHLASGTLNQPSNIENVL